MSDRLATPEQVGLLLATTIDQTMNNSVEFPHRMFASSYAWIGEAAIELPDPIRERAGLTPDEASGYFPRTIFNKAAYLNPKVPLALIHFMTERPEGPVRPQDWIRYTINTAGVQAEITKQYCAVPQELKEIDALQAAEERAESIKNLLARDGALSTGEITPEFAEEFPKLLFMETMRRIMRTAAAHDEALQFAEAVGLASVYADEVESLQEAVESWH